MIASKPLAVMTLAWLTVTASSARADSTFVSLNRVYTYSGSTGRLLSTTSTTSTSGPGSLTIVNGATTTTTTTSVTVNPTPPAPAPTPVPTSEPAPVPTSEPAPIPFHTSAPSPIPVQTPAPTPTPIVAPVETPAPTPVIAPVATPVAAPVVAAPAAPVPTPEPTPIPVAAPVVATAAPLSAPVATPQAAAFINFGTTPYADASSLASGTPQAWYNSPTVAAAFGHTPDAAEQTQFRQAVLQDIDKTFQISGIGGPGNAVSNFYVTDNPNVPAAHMMSVASGVTALGNSQAIGLTSIGTNGFNFIDQFGPAAGTGAADPVTNLEWAVAHNLSHELMHAFGVAIHPDTTGTYLDAASANWSQLTDPNFKLSPLAVQDILSSNEITKNVDGGTQYGYEMIGHPRFCQCPLCRALLTEDHRPHGAELVAGGVSAVPEPATIVLWGLAGAVLAGHRLVKRRRTV